jgi:hypothetical protein
MRDDTRSLASSVAITSFVIVISTISPSLIPGRKKAGRWNLTVSSSRRRRTAISPSIIERRTFSFWAHDMIELFWELRLVEAIPDRLLNAQRIVTSLRCRFVKMIDGDNFYP